MPGISPDKRPPRLIYHRRTPSKELLLRAATGTSFFTIREIKTAPYVPLSHPFVERLIGTLRRECLDRTLFWTITDLEAKLLDFQHY